MTLLIPRTKSILVMSFLAVVLPFLSDVALGQITGRDVLEQRLHSKLDRILTAEEYLLDIRLTPDIGNSGVPSDKFLPGLQVLGPVYDEADTTSRSIVLGGRADLLLILDKKVSKERAQVAKDIVSRTIDAEGLKGSVKISTQQRDIKKTPEAPAAPPPPPRDPTLLEQLVQEKEFLSRALLVFWGGLVSLMAIYFLLRRFLLAGKSNEGDVRVGPTAGTGGQIASSGANDLAKNTGARGEKTRDDLYSKDEALLATIKEITEESKAHPSKSARILSRWVSQNSELSRAAAIYLRNCDIKTVELLCQAMHPSDLEKIVANKIEDFEPFGAENQRVIERMRADLAILASEVVLGERPDPLSFLRRLSDDDIRNLLVGETEETIALVASQLPAHRLHKFYESVPAESLKAIVSKLSCLKSASVGDFESLQALLTTKMQVLSGNLVNERDLCASIQTTISSLASPSLQCELTDKLKSENARIYEKVRPTLLLPTDLRYIPGRIKSLLVQSIDADTLGTALSDFQISFEDLLEGLPPAYQSVFKDAQAKRVEASQVNEAWRVVNRALTDLISAGLISKTELTFVIRRADEAANRDPEQNEDGSDGFGRGAA